MKKLLLGLFCCFMLSNCQEEKVSLTLPEEALVDVLTDIHLAEAAVYNVYGSNKDSLINVYYGQVYRIHQVTAEQVTENIQILMENPSKANAIYGKVIDNIAEKEK